MPVSRRTLLALSGSFAALSAASAPAWAQDASLTGERAVGDPKAPVQVMEFFSLTCTHCAAFARETFPQVKSELIDKGKLHYVFRDFPLDRVALLGEMVARALPPDRYEPFLLAMFRTQDRWAFAQGVNSTEEIGKMAALAGLPVGCVPEGDPRRQAARLDSRRAGCGREEIRHQQHADLRGQRPEGEGSGACGRNAVRRVPEDDRASGGMTHCRSRSPGCGSPASRASRSPRAWRSGPA